MCLLQKETITLKRGGEKGLGFSIAGGRGSTPYKDGDSVNLKLLEFVIPTSYYEILMLQGK